MSVFSIEDNPEQLSLLEQLQHGVDEKKDHWSTMIGTKIDFNKNADQPTSQGPPRTNCVLSGD